MDGHKAEKPSPLADPEPDRLSGVA